MKQLIIGFTIGILALGTAQAQNKHGFGIHFGGYDFYGPISKHYVLSDRYTYKYNTGSEQFDTTIKQRLYWRPMVKLSYWFQLNKMMDVSLHLSGASLEYPKGENDTNFTRKYLYNVGDRTEKFLGEFDARFNFNILPRESWIISPYIFAGLNASYHDIYFGAGVPLGLGAHINLTKDRALTLNLESAYKLAVTKHDQEHLQHSIGFVYWFTPGYKAPRKETGDTMTVADLRPILDSDNDGINDTEDQCPTVAGTAQFNGCPDSDGDGISDRDDQCPLVAGMAQHNGCPDTDSDGIPDNTDKCPYVAGMADRQGCPIPDKDNDGFNDDEDRCPDVYSTTNQGCPEIRKEIITQVEKAAKAIFFDVNKATIKRVSFKSLDAVVRILKADPSLYADIEGHTDSDADDAYNMKLSQDRAEAVRQYFISKGIDATRMTSQGFGETQPVADNGTAAGKAQNRRTVIKLRNYAK